MSCGWRCADGGQAAGALGPWAPASLSPVWEPQGTELLPDPRAVSLRSGSLAFLPAVDEASGRPPRPFAGCCCLGPLSARSAPVLAALNGTGLVGTVLLARVLWCLPRPCRTLSPRARACEPVCKLGKVGLQLAVPPPPHRRGPGSWPCSRFVPPALWGGACVLFLLLASQSRPGSVPSLAPPAATGY